MAKRYFSINQIQHVHDLVRPIAVTFSSRNCHFTYYRNQCSEL